MVELQRPSRARIVSDRRPPGARVARRPPPRAARPRRPRRSSARTRAASPAASGARTSAASSPSRARLRRRSTTSACAAKSCWRRRPRRSMSRWTKRSGRVVSSARGGLAVELEEGEDALARLGRQLRRLGRGDERADHVELAPPRDLDAAREVDRAQLDRRPRERAHHGAGVGRGRRAAAARRARRAPRRAGRTPPRRRLGTGPRAPRARPRPPGPRRAPSARARAMRSGRTPSRTSRSTSAATLWACARSFAQRQNSTSPPGAASGSAVPSRSAIGRDDRAARRRGSARASGTTARARRPSPAGAAR